MADFYEALAWSDISGEEQQRIIKNLSNFFHNGTSNCN